MRDSLSKVARCAGFAAAALVCSTIGATAHDSLTDTGGTWDRGAVSAFSAATPQAWVRKYFSPANQCLHLQVRQLSTAADLEMLVVAPNPQIVYRNDDGGSTASCSLCPRVDVSPTPLAGYYTVIILPHSSPGTNTEFVLEMTRDSNQANCISTPPVARATRQKK